MNGEKKDNLPRMTISFPFGMSPDFMTQSTDLNDSDLSSIFDKALLLPNAEVKIQYGGKTVLDTNFKVLWSKYLVGNKAIKFGVPFVRFKENDLKVLKALMIESFISPLLEKIEDKQKRVLVEKFWMGPFFEYLNAISEIAYNCKHKNLNKEEAFQRVFAINEKILKAGDQLEQVLRDKLLTKKIKKMFRELSGPLVYTARIVKHGYEKPRGYPGDNQLLEIIYEQKPLSEGIGYCYDKYLLENEYAVAVRNRKDMMQELMKEYLEATSLPEVSVLNIACGSSRDLKELFIDKKFAPPSQKVRIALVDHDQQALDFSRDVLAGSPENVEYSYLPHNIVEYGREPEKYVALIGKKDLVYSIGLADYLPERVFKQHVSFLFSLLNKGGKLIIAHKDSKGYKPLAPDWWCDWTFYPRNEEEVLDLFRTSGIQDYGMQVKRDPSRVIFFVAIEKK